MAESRDALVPAGDDDRRLAILDAVPPEKRYRAASRFNLPWGLWVVVVAYAIVIVVVLPGMSALAQILIGGGGVLGLLVWVIRGVRSGIGESTRAVRLLTSGRVDEGNEILEGLLEGERWHPHQPLFIHNRAFGFLVDGQPRRAFALFNGLRRSGAFDRIIFRDFRHLPHAFCALTLALMGELAEAERILGALTPLLDETTEGHALLPRAVVLARLGEYERAAGLLRRDWKKAENVGTGKPLRVIRAFVVEHLEGRGSDEVRKLIDGLFPCEPEQVSWLAVDWPELDEFLRRHDVA